ncbi:MAG: hypothetical protein QNJ36_03385 [Calothrix sp. MO_167.B42]|nr:hypothetical protein [Calothrix sp. MO_167.B42]
MSDKTIEGYGKGYLVLLLPISFLIIFLVATWPVLVAFIVLALGLTILDRYRWQSWCEKINPIFNQMLYENQGKITPVDLAIRCNFSGSTAKRYLDTKAKEFGFIPSDTENGNKVYYFLTGSNLSNILDSSDPIIETKPAVSRTPTQLLAPPPQENKQEVGVEVEPESAPPSHGEAKVPLEKQLIFGSLIQSELAKRLNVYSSTVYKRRNDPDCPQWSRNRDPDGVAWVYSPSTKEFFPEDEENQS